MAARNPYTASRFQSSPTPKGGRYDGLDTNVSGLTKVSILAHPERWALPSPAVLKHMVAVFQSSPTPKGGRY